MEFRFNMPVELLFGTGIIMKNTEKVVQGTKALIVTGKNSARLSGALDDVLSALEKEKKDYCIYDGVMNNPNLDNVALGAAFGKTEGADFIIAIGGGSPLDAAKAVSALMTNDIEPIELIRKVPKNKSLPIVAVPTTSGTGSEVTPYSILTVPSLRTKKNFYSPYSFPVVSFADPAYTHSLPYDITLDTAFDAFSHLLESYLSKKSTPLNDAISIEGMKAFARCREDLVKNQLDETVRELLMYASCTGGIAITHTGTTLIHAMGYSLTYFKGYSHGRANAMIIGDYLEFNREREPYKIQKVLNILGFDSIEETGRFFNTGMDRRPSLTDKETDMFTELAMSQGSVAMNPGKVQARDIKKLYHKISGGNR